MELKAALLLLCVAASASPTGRTLRGEGSNVSWPANGTLQHGNHTAFSPENFTAYLLDGFRAFAKAVGAESMFNNTLAEEKSKNCLCIFDIDRTLTGKQEDRRCSGNKVIHGTYDDAYGGGALTLSHLGQHVWGTFCGSCHVRAITAHHRYRQNIPVQQSVINCDKGCKAYKAGKMAESMGISKSEVYMFDDKASNVRPFYGTGMNAHQVSCHSREGSRGLCGGKSSEVSKRKGVSTCR